MNTRPIQLGFTLIGDGQWKGGLNYQRTLFQLLAGPLAGRIEPCLFVTPEQEALVRNAFESFLPKRLVIDRRVSGAGRGRRGIEALATGRDWAFAALVQENGVDVVFETARFFGWRFPLPIVSWMPDFQHRHLPNLFTRKTWWRREVGFRMQTFGCRVMLLSSEAARHDCETFYPRTQGRTRIAKFSSAIDLAEVKIHAQAVRIAYDLPDRFVYLPNHFWTHKNHAVVLNALRRLKELGSLHNALPVVMSGPVEDHRNAGLFERAVAMASAEGLLPWFRHIGLVPYNDVLALNATADAVVNPSLFEGWASSVEEAKSLGTPLLLSDIPVHREQAPDAAFFSAHDAEALARLLLRVTRRPAMDGVELIVANANRIREFAASFVDAVQAINQEGGTRSWGG